MMARMACLKFFLVGLVLILSTALAACASDVARFTVEGTDDLKFIPDTITVKRGQTVELTLVNKGKLPHTFSVPDLSIEAQMPPGETNKITFLAPKVGEYTFSSGVIGDFETMKGKLVVR